MAPSKITMNQQSYLYQLLERKNSHSSVLNPDFWGKTADLSESAYKELLWLIRNDKVSECEMLIKNYDSKTTTTGDAN